MIDALQDEWEYRGNHLIEEEDKKDEFGWSCKILAIVLITLDLLFFIAIYSAPTKADTYYYSIEMCKDGMCPNYTQRYQFCEAGYELNKEKKLVCKAKMVDRCR